MRSIATLTREEARAVDALLFDLDDTLLSHGVLSRAAYGALWDLRDAGIALFAVTGRPSGWGELVLRQWPIDGAVAENGAVVLTIEKGSMPRRIVRSLRGSLAEQRGLDVRRSQIVEAIRREIPSLDLADDNAARLTDTTLDIGEHVRVDAVDVARARAIARDAGARTIVSSVHMHISFEGDDKASGALRMLHDVRGLDVGSAKTRAAFIGDSENDSACFSCFSTTVGVANVARYVDRLSVPPRFVTAAPMGDGFAELACTLIERRSSRDPA